MSRQPHSTVVSYAAVSGACEELIKQGDAPSVRKLRAYLGVGSFSTLNSYYHRWQDEQRLVEKADTEISEAFRQAVLAEIGRATGALEKKMTEDLSLEKKRLSEAQSLLLECETQAEKLKADFELRQDALEQKCLNLEKELTIARALAEDNAKREKEYQGQIEILRQEAKQAELKAAVSEAKREALEKQLSRFEQV